MARATDGARQPVQPPPPPVVESYRARRGWVWVGGQLPVARGRYVWFRGHWERERSGWRWSPGRWELAGQSLRLDSGWLGRRRTAAAAAPAATAAADLRGPRAAAGRRLHRDRAAAPAAARRRRSRRRRAWASSGSRARTSGATDGTSGWAVTGRGSAAVTAGIRATGSARATATTGAKVSGVATDRRAPAGAVLSPGGRARGSRARSGAVAAGRGCSTGPSGGGTPGPGRPTAQPTAARDPGYAIVVLPDTQYYAASWPDIFLAQTRWLVENRDAERIAFVLHTGDIVDSDTPAQWEVASRSLHALDGQLPYVIAAGNHDYSNLADRMGMGNIYFPPSGFAQFPWFGGTFEPGHIENSFSLISAGSTRWLVISLEFGPRDEVLAWADSVLKLFRDRPAIVITHAFLYHDGTRYDHTGFYVQNFNPHDYVMMGQPGTTINDGEEMWQKLIEPNGNVKLVFSGHDVSGNDLPPGTAGHLTSTRADGSVVHQILANYQTCTAAALRHLRPGEQRLRRGGFSAHPALLARRPDHLRHYLLALLRRVPGRPGNRFVLPMN